MDKIRLLGLIRQYHSSNRGSGNREIRNDISFIESFIFTEKIYSDNFEGIISYKIEECIAKMQRIKSGLGDYNELYLELSNHVVISTQEKMMRYINDVVAGYSQMNSNMVKYYEMHNRATKYLELFSFTGKITDVLDGMYLIGKFKMDYNIRISYEKNFEDIKSLAQKLPVGYQNYMNPKEKLRLRLNNYVQELDEIRNSLFLKSDIDKEIQYLNKIGKWQMFRSKSDKLQQIKEQEVVINQLRIKSEQVKQSKILEKKNEINNTIKSIQLFEEQF